MQNERFPCAHNVLEGAGSAFKFIKWTGKKSLGIVEQQLKIEFPEAFFSQYNRYKLQHSNTWYAPHTKITAANFLVYTRSECEVYFPGRQASQSEMCVCSGKAMVLMTPLSNGLWSD